MLLGRRFEAFIDASPVSVMIRGTLERVLDPDELQEVFEDNAVSQYTREITFAQCGEVMSDVVFQVSPSVGAWYKGNPDALSVTRQALYDKLKHIEVPVSSALVRRSDAELRPALKAMGIRPRPLLPGYRVRALDGNHLSGTDHRILELRRYRAAAAAGFTAFAPLMASSSGGCERRRWRSASSPAANWSRCGRCPEAFWSSKEPLRGRAAAAGRWRYPAVCRETGQRRVASSRANQ